MTQEDDYTQFLTSRDLSRMVIIPFNLPKIGAETAAECEAFQSLGALRKTASAAIGWAISLGKKFKTSGITNINSVLLIAKGVSEAERSRT